jgi:hypothetical protein
LGRVAHPGIWTLYGVLITMLGDRDADGDRDVPIQAIAMDQTRAQFHRDLCLRPCFGTCLGPNRVIRWR